MTRTASVPTEDLAAPAEAARTSPVRPIYFWLPLIATACAWLATWLLDLGNTVVACLVVVTMLVLVVMKLPIGITMIVPSVLGLLVMNGVTAGVGALRLLPFDSTASWSLTVLPMFVLMGMLLANSGWSTRLYGAIQAWFGWVPGGLAVGTTAAGAGMASISGSTAGIVYTLTRVAAPQMLRAGYDKRIVAGSILMAGMPGQLIPPSVFLVIYAGVTSVPVGAQLVAGIIPGLAIAAAYCLLLVLLSLRFGKQTPAAAGADRDRAPRSTSATWAQRWASLRGIWALPLLVGIVVGGMVSGFFTATEAGAAGVLGAVLVTLLSGDRGGRWSAIRRSLMGTVSSVSAIFLLIIGAGFFTRVLSVSGVARQLTDEIMAWDLDPTVFLLILIVFYLVLGLCFDALSMILLTVPVLIPVLISMDIDLIWFGIFVVLLAELAAVTPPIGVLIFIVHNLMQNPEVNVGHKVSLGDVLGSLWYVLPLAILFLIAMIFFPGIVVSGA